MSLRGRRIEAAASSSRIRKAKPIPTSTNTIEAANALWKAVTEFCSPKTVANAATPIEAATRRLVLKSADAQCCLKPLY